MLRTPFDRARQEIDDHLSQRDYQTGQTWFEFCRERGFSYSEMLSGMDWEKKLAEKTAKPLPPA